MLRKIKKAKEEKLKLLLLISQLIKMRNIKASDEFNTSSL